MKTTYEIIKFKDGRYALKETIISWFGLSKKVNFVSRFSPEHRWSSLERVDEYCKGNLVQIENIYDMFTDNGEVVK